MHNDRYKRQAQQLEQVIATIFTCRSVIKYNLSVDENHKEGMLQDIDTSIEVIRAYMLANMPAPPPSTDLPVSPSDNTTIVHDDNEPRRDDDKTYAILQSLYRMYHAFLDTNEQTNLQLFVTCFNEITSVVDEVQRLFKQKSPLAHDMYSSQAFLNSSPRPIVVEDLLEQVKIFISDLYYIFMDFIRTLSSVLQQNDVQLNTEKLSSLPGGRRSEKIRRVQLERLHEQSAARQGVQEAYRQLYQRRLQVEPQISEVTAFLDFLKEILRAPETKVYQLREILARMDTVSWLLAELLQIVTSYEKIAKLE